MWHAPSHFTRYAPRPEMCACLSAEAGTQEPGSLTSQSLGPRFRGDERIEAIHDPLSNEYDHDQARLMRRAFFL